MKSLETPSKTFEYCIELVEFNWVVIIFAQSILKSQN